MNDLFAKVKEESFALLPPTIFFFIALHIVAFVRLLMLKQTSLQATSTISVTIAALILGKAVLIADMLPFINRFPQKPLVYNVAWKTAIYLLVAAVVHYLERLIDFWRQAGGFVAGNQKLLAEMVWPHFWAIQILLFVLILMYCTTRELIRVIGKDKVLCMFFGPLPAVLLCLTLLSGCTQLGPPSINRDRFDYGAAVADSWKQQALLNIVKMRYADNPVFVDVASIVAGYSMQTTVSGGLGYNLGIHGPDSASLGAQGQFTDRPTITYVPLTGQQYLRGLLTPIAPASVLFLIQSGYAADFVLQMTVESINGLNNRSAAPARVNPGDAEFFEVVELTRKVQRSGNIGMRIEMDKSKKEATLLTFPRRHSSAELKAQTAEIGRLLRLEPNANDYRVAFGMAAGGGTDIDMATRSLVQIMVELADAVDVPQAHLDDHSAYPSLPGTAGVKPLMRVASAAARPTDDYAAVQYRGCWFWIDRRDLVSKRTFSSLQGLFNFADTGKAENLPLVTIPAQ